MTKKELKKVKKEFDDFYWEQGKHRERRSEARMRWQFIEKKLQEAYRKGYIRAGMDEALFKSNR